MKRIHGLEKGQDPAAVMVRRVDGAWLRGGWASGLGRGLVVAALVIMMQPVSSWAGACDDKLGEIVQVTGSYVPAGQAYAQAFVFAMRLDCHGSQELVTVQRSTGRLPVCTSDEQVEVVGKLVWNRTLVDGHYEISNPSKVVCVAAGRGEAIPARAREGPPPVAVPAPVQAEPRRPAARAMASSVWIGRYQDSRGAGDVTFTLVRGTSTVSGTWRLRTGGGGPLAGNLEGDGRRLEFRMENMAAECPGTFQGTAELTDIKLAGTYRGQDCEGTVTDGRLELRPQER